MPVGYSSPSRNLFLLGAVGGDVVTNFFQGVDRSLDTYNSFRLKQLNYAGSVGSTQNYIIGGNKYDGTSYLTADTHGWFEKRTFNSETLANTSVYEVTISSTIDDNVEINDIKLDSYGNTYVAGRADSTCFVGKYDSTGSVVWNSTSFTGDAIFYGLALDSSLNLYACGQTNNADENAIVQRFDSNGNVLWGKTISTTNGIVKLQRCATNSRGHLVAVGYIEDATHEGEYQTKFKGYIIKLDIASGNILWTRTLEDRYYYSSIGIAESILCEDITIDNDDDIYVVGRMLWDGTKYHSFIVKYTPEGNIVWQNQTPRDNTHRVQHFAVKTDSDTKQTVVFGDYYNTSTADASALLSKYDRAGNLLWRRKVTSSEQGSSWTYDTRLDADSTFYYMAFTDDNTNLTTGDPDRYVFGKVSTSGNGLGSFQYDDGTGRTLDYTILTLGDTPSKLWDGSVRQDVTDFITYPYSANKLLFDDLATQISNKKAQIAEAGTYQESGSPAIRVADFQELNLLGDVYSGSGNWLDQSGNGNDGVVNGATWNASGWWEFDGVDDYIDLGTQPVDSDLNMSSPSGGGLAVEWWGYYNGTGDNFQRIVDRSNGGGSLNGWAIYTGAVGSSTQIRLTTNGESVVLTTGAIFTSNIWQHWCITWDQSSGDWAWYLNGEQTNTGNASWNIPAVETGMRIGTWNHSTGREYNGRIGEVRIYPRALTPAQVFQNYNATKSKYINEAPDTAPKISDSAIVYDSNLLLNYDFGNRATYDRVENLLSNSNDLSSSYWQSGGSQGLPTRTQDALSPVGDLTAWTVDDTATGADGQGMDGNISGLTASSTQTYTMSVYAKQGTAAKFDMYCFFKPTIRGTRLSYTWDTNQIFTNGSDNGGADVVSSGQENVGNGWYRIWMEVIDSTIGTNTELEFRLYPASRDTGPTGSTLFWNPQVVRGSTPGRYIKTSGISITAPTTVKNLSSTSYTGTINGATFNSAGYFDFDGVDDFISAGNSVITTGSTTISMWVRPSLSQTAGLADLNVGGGGLILYQIGTIIMMGFRGNPEMRTSGGIAFTANQWQHITWVYNNGAKDSTSSFVIYKNAVAETTLTTSGSIGGTTVTNRIGSDQSSAYSNSDIGEVRIYNRALTASEVSQNFNATRSKYGV